MFAQKMLDSSFTLQDVTEKHQRWNYLPIIDILKLPQLNLILKQMLNPNQAKAICNQDIVSFLDKILSELI